MSEETFLEKADRYAADEAAEPTNPPKAPKVGRRYAQHKAMKYGDTDTALSVDPYLSKYARPKERGKRRARK